MPTPFHNLWSSTIYTSFLTPLNLINFSIPLKLKLKLKFEITKCSSEVCKSLSCPGKTSPLKRCPSTPSFRSPTRSTAPSRSTRSRPAATAAPTRRGTSRWSSRWARRRCGRTPSPSNSGNAADDKQVVVGSLSVSVKQLFDSRKSPYVGSVSGEDGGGKLTFSYKFFDESAPNAGGSGSGWNRVENATKAAVNGAMKAAANGANEAMWTLVKGVKEAKKMVESGGLGSKDEKNKGFQPKKAGWFGWGPKKSKTEIAIEAKMKERVNFKPPPQTPSHQPTTSSKPGPSHQNSTSYKPGQTQADHNSTFNTAEATATLYKPFESATKFMSSIGTKTGHFGQGGGKE